jgi:hypothetical protein
MSLDRVPMASLLAGALPLAWLLSNHYMPWLSAWQEGVAIALLLLAALLCRHAPLWPRLWLAAVAVMLLSIAGQALTGKILFAGDALMAAFYVTLFGLSVLLGTALGRDEPGRATPALIPALAFGLVAGAIASTAVAWVQWTGAVSLGIYGVDLRPGDRPSGNVAQPNHFCTIAFLGLCGLAALREQRRIGPMALALGAPFLMSGMVLSGSRTGWLQMALGALLAVALARRTGARVGARPVLAGAALFLALTLAWPALTEQVDLQPTRPTSDQLGAGTRPHHWRALGDAALRAPLAGYGWQQVALAQQATALDHPPIGEHVESSHNMVLDLLLWAGIPIGGLVVVLLALALLRQLLVVRESSVGWLLVGVVGLFVHGQLEYPLQYAYFLLPAGLIVGLAHVRARALSRSGSMASAPPPSVSPRAARLALPMMSVALSTLFAGIAADYLPAEENHRVLRLETARVGVTRLETPAVQLRLLNQLQAFLEFARDEPRRGMSVAEVEKMRRVSERFAYPPAMFRYALASGLNGRPDVATTTLARLCRIHSRLRCEDAIAAWLALQKKHPELRDIAPPVLPWPPRPTS